MKKITLDEINTTLNKYQCESDILEYRLKNQYSGRKFKRNELEYRSIRIQKCYAEILKLSEKKRNNFISLCIELSRLNKEFNLGNRNLQLDAAKAEQKVNSFISKNKMVRWDSEYYISVATGFKY